MNLKNERIKKLWLSGVRDPVKIAKKLGLHTVQRVHDGLALLQQRGEINGYEADTMPSDPA